MVKKIVIIGPESTGKSMLCQQLAVQYNTIWVKEYAREYLLQNGIQYTYEDLLTIAKGQIEAEELAIGHCSINPQAPSDSQQPTANSQLLFIDTDMYVMKVWCEFVFDKCHGLILVVEQFNAGTVIMCLIKFGANQDTFSIGNASA